MDYRPPFVKADFAPVAKHVGRLEDGLKQASQSHGNQRSRRWGRPEGMEQERVK